MSQSTSTVPTADGHRYSGPLVAIVVIVLAVAVVIAFAAVTFRSGPSTPIRTSTDLSPTPARPVLAPIITLGQPPQDVIDSLVVPLGATSVGYLNNAAGGSQYDATVKLRLSAPVDDVIAFYAGELRDLGWNVRSVGPAHGGKGRQVVAIRQSSDSYTWEVGVTATAEAGSTAGTTSTAKAANTLVSLRVFQMSDD